MSLESLVTLGMQFISLEARSAFGTPARDFATKGIVATLGAINKLPVNAESNSAWRRVYELWLATSGL